MNKIKNILIFAGAGISAESGLSTFRDVGGIWKRYNLNEVCSYPAFIAAKHFPEKRKAIFDFYNEAKEAILKAEPNAAHLQVAAWQKEYGSDRVKIVTSNIDDLFEKAGCENVIHVHGEVSTMRCAQGCGHIWDIGTALFNHEDRCPKCTSRMTKPNVVFFGEMAPQYYDMARVFGKKVRSPDDALLWIGSSMQVVRPDDLNFEIGQSILVDKNTETSDLYKPLFKHFYYGDATEQLALIDKEIIKPYAT